MLALLNSLLKFVAHPTIRVKSFHHNLLEQENYRGVFCALDRSASHATSVSISFTMTLEAVLCREWKTARLPSIEVLPLRVLMLRNVYGSSH